MVKNDLINELAIAFPGITKKDMAAIVNTLFESVTEGLSRGEPIDIRGLGRLRVKKRRPIKARNPRTDEPVDVPRRWVIHFKAADSLVKRMNEKSR